MNKDFLNKTIDSKVKSMMKKAMNKVVNDMGGVPIPGDGVVPHEVNVNVNLIPDGDPDSKGGTELAPGVFLGKKMHSIGSISGSFKKPLPPLMGIDSKGNTFTKESLDAAAKKIVSNTQELMEGYIMGEATSTEPEPKTSAVKLKKKIKLYDAVDVGQHVNGTSSSSVYITVAVHPEIKLAIRYSDLELSMRVEGNGIHKFATKLNILKFVKSSEDHYSTHLKVPSQWEAMKVVGAVVFGLQINWTQAMVNLDTLTDWGT